MPFRVATSNMAVVKFQPEIFSEQRVRGEHFSTRIFWDKPIWVGQNGHLFPWNEHTKWFKSPTNHMYTTVYSWSCSINSLYKATKLGNKVAKLLSILQHHVILVFFKSLCTCFSWALGISWAKSSSLQCLTLMRQLLADGTAKPIPLPWIQQVINPMWSVLRRWNQPIFCGGKPRWKTKTPFKGVSQKSVSLQFFAVIWTEHSNGDISLDPRRFESCRYVAMPPRHKLLKLRNNKNNYRQWRCRKLTGWRFPQMVVDCKGIHPQKK